MLALCPLVLVFGAAVTQDSPPVAACEGDSITLPCNGPNNMDPQSVVVLWKNQKGIVIYKFKNGTSDADPNYKNRTKLSDPPKKDFSLTINPVLISDDQTYTCEVNYTQCASIQLFVNASTEPGCVGKKSPDGSNSAADGNHPTYVWALVVVGCFLLVGVGV